MSTGASTSTGYAQQQKVQKYKNTFFVNSREKKYFWTSLEN